MAEEEIEINDLYTVAKEMPDDWHAPDGTHFTEEGYRALAEAVVKALKG
jgi:lysophospholipase L1-like esterase